MAGAIVQAKEGSDVTSGTTILSGQLSANVTAGNKLWIVANAGDNVTITPTKNAGTATIGTITPQGSIQEAGVLDKLEHFTCDVTGTGTLDILVTFGASNDHRCVLVVEISGADSIEDANEVTDTGSNPTPNINLSVANVPSFGLSACADYQGGTPAAGSGWTSYGTFWVAVTPLRVQTRAISTAGTITANFGNAGFDRNNSVGIVFRDQTAGPSFVPSIDRHTRFHLHNLGR